MMLHSLECISAFFKKRVRAEGVDASPQAQVVLETVWGSHTLRRKKSLKVGRPINCLKSYYKL